MQAPVWSARGHVLQFESIEDASAQCVGAARLGAIQVTAPVFNIWVQVRGDGWIESREGRFRMRRGDWMAFEKESTPLIQAGPRGVCIGVALDARALEGLQALNDGSLYAGRGRLPSQELRMLLRLWREASVADDDGVAIRPLLLQLAAVQRDLACLLYTSPSPRDS